MPSVDHFHRQNVPVSRLNDLIQARRDALWIARLLPRGSERNQQRQIAASLRRLIKEDEWAIPHVRRERLLRGVWSWQAIESAPFDLPLELAVIDQQGPRAVAFPCRRAFAGWSDENGNRVFVHPSHWREWRRLS